MAIVTQYSPRYREQHLKELPDKLFEVELNQEEVEKVIDMIPELKRLFDIKKDWNNAFNIKLIGRVTAKYFKKEEDGSKKEN